MREIEGFRERNQGVPFIWYQSCIRAMVETRGGAQIGVLEENIQRVQQQVDDHTGSIERLHLKVDGFRLEWLKFEL